MSVGRVDGTEEQVVGISTGDSTVFHLAVWEQHVFDDACIRMDANDRIAYADQLLGFADEMAKAHPEERGVYQRVETLLRAGIEAIEANPKLLADDVDMGVAYYEWAWVLQKFGKFGSAVTALQRAIAGGDTSKSTRELLDGLIQCGLTYDMSNEELERYLQQ